MGYDEVKNKSEWSIKEYLNNRFTICNEGKEYLEIVERLLIPASVAMVPLAPVDDDVQLALLRHGQFEQV